MDRDTILRASEIKFINLTGHDVYIGNKVVVSSGTKPVRLLNGRVLDGEMVMDDKNELSIPIYRFNSETQVVGLPDPEEGTMIIVSAMVRKHLTTLGYSRTDVVSPYAIETTTIDGEKIQCANALAR